MFICRICVFKHRYSSLFHVIESDFYAVMRKKKVIFFFALITLIFIDNLGLGEVLMFACLSLLVQILIFSPRHKLNLTLKKIRNFLSGICSVLIVNLYIICKFI